MALRSGFLEIRKLEDSKRRYRIRYAWTAAFSFFLCGVGLSSRDLMMFLGASPDLN